VPFAEKSATAIFVGSTTGHRGPITVDAVRKLAFPRLRSAVFFKDNPLVDFRLARILQSTPEAEQVLRPNFRSFDLSIVSEQRLERRFQF
jgi:hypothetical protein